MGYSPCSYYGHAWSAPLPTGLMVCTQAGCSAHVVCEVCAAGLVPAGVPRTRCRTHAAARPVRATLPASFPLPLWNERG